MATWRRKAREAPAEPGVYLLLDAAGTPLYVGKAKSLRTRLRSYLEDGRQGPKTALMLTGVKNLQYIVTDSELEALILENSLIKKHRPKYNVSLKDDKTYPFLRLSVEEEFPNLTVVRRPLDDGAKYFGPYVPAGAMRRTLRLLERIYPLRRCRGPLRARSRPCLNFQLGRCLAPCSRPVDPLEYRRMVEEVSLFLQGRGKDLSERLKKRMGDMARLERFEEAALLRDRAAAIDSTMEKQKMHLPERGDMDVVGHAMLGERLAFVVLRAADGRIVGARTYTSDLPLEETSAGDNVAVFLRKLYDGKAPVPPEILLPEAPAGAAALSAWLGQKRGGKVILRTPQRGPLKSLVTMASRNALQLLEKKASPGSLREGLLEELAKAAGTGGELRSLAAMDVSAIAGTDPVASLVWWERGGFVKERYRRFRLSPVPSSDDFAMMGEAVARMGRRVAQGEWQSPDVLMLDGGRGHLAAGMRALGAARWSPALLASIAKPGEARDVDAVFVAGRREPLPLDRGSALLLLLQAVRDEAHRFALAHHRKLRRRRSRTSALDGIPGLGPVRRRALLRHFGSITRLRKASFEELRALPGIPSGVARAVYERLRGWEERGAVTRGEERITPPGFPEAGRPRRRSRSHGRRRPWES